LFYVYSFGRIFAEMAAFLPQSWQKHSAQVNLVDRLIHRRNRAGDRFDNELLAAIEAEKAETLESLARDIHSGSYQRRMYGETNQAVINATMAALANCVLRMTRNIRMNLWRIC
jgi:hypothetical protein